MCYNCGKLRSVLYGVSLADLLEKGDNYGRGTAAAAIGCYEEIVRILRASGGCSSCIGMVENRIRNTF